VSDATVANVAKKTQIRYCGNDDCCASMGICGRVTFGYGELDNHGYWEHPCVICAAVALRFAPSSYPEGVWPEPGESAIPDWAGQATPGAQLTCVRSAIEQTILNIKEGFTPPSEILGYMTPLIEQLKKLEENLQHRSW